MTTKTYSLDLRKRIVIARKEGHSANEIAKWFKVSKRSVERYWKSYKQNGHVKAKQRGGYRRSRLASHDHLLCEWIKQQPDLTLEQLQDRCYEKLDIQLGISALWHRLNQLGLSFKKNSTRK